MEDFQTEILWSLNVKRATFDKMAVLIMFTFTFLKVTVFRNIATRLFFIWIHKVAVKSLFVFTLVWNCLKTPDICRLTLTVCKRWSWPVGGAALAKETEKEILHSTDIGSDEVTEEGIKVTDTEGGRS